MEIIFQLGLVLFLVFLNGFFVASEFALVAVRKTRIDVLAKKGNRTAKLVQGSLENLDTFISATQLGITLASLALGWVGEPAIAHFLEPFLNNYLPKDISFISAHGLSIVIAFSFITFLHIVLGELAPKSIALQKSELTSLIIITPLIFFTKVFKPFVVVLNGAGNLVLHVFGFSAPSSHQLVHSEEEIKMILAQSAEEGVFEKQEVEMVNSVLKLGDTTVRKIMIPRTKIVALEKNTSLKKVIIKTQKSPQSRFPVYENTIDNIIGFIHVKDIFRNLINFNNLGKTNDVYKNFLEENSEKTLSQIKAIRKIPHIPEDKRIDDVLIEMKKKQIHIAVVDDDNGGTAGIVSLEDVIESLVGEIHDEFEILEKDNENLLKKVLNN